MNITVVLSRDENIQHYNATTISIDIEEYVKGVVGSEIGNASIEACKAQAVAARTFAFIKHSNGKQLTDKSSSDQAFRISRISSAYANALRAVEDTAGQVLYYEGKLINCCPYSNSNGGRIKSSQEVWGGVRAWLISKEDPYDNGSGNGHGVGMSQVGAKKMASLGLTYKDILQFYYPGTTIKEGYGMSNNAEKVKTWCLSKKGCGYVWGATGQKLTQAVLTALYNRHPDEVDKDLCWRLWQGKQVYDCAGFASEAMKQIGFSITAGAGSAWRNGKWAQKGTIDSLPKDKVCCLYRHNPAESNPNKMKHTGIYFGDGTFMDSRGTKSGVIGPNAMSTYPWTHWAIPPQLVDETTEYTEPEVIKVAYQAKVTASSGSTVNMRASASSSAKVIQQIGIGQVVDVIGTTGDWSQITWNGKSGYMMTKFLTKVSGSESNNVWYVRIECDSEAQAKAVAQILNKAKATT